MEAKREADVKAHFEEAAASYKRLLSGAVMASSESKKPRHTPVTPVVETVIRPHEPAPAATPAPVPVKPAVATMPVCRTYMEANALLNR